MLIILLQKCVICIDCVYRVKHSLQPLYAPVVSFMPAASLLVLGGGMDWKKASQNYISRYIHSILFGFRGRHPQEGQQGQPRSPSHAHSISGK